ncbi:hypothetical protein CONLIGDRAFT_686823 [Coniochaeta ligniaria NRRL 30616]|uniref:Uncharacterized protein n=1 Tax=Coniochaeta ligniaria NRRL 30616 TaxID=1408157 RepID=A0A1J7J796_9PEZI|nr:hypothetical protein CONLIGDRAFT_686823 [Coniochaeta ligniaria NRRL 30616]
MGISQVPRPFTYFIAFTADSGVIQVVHYFPLRSLNIDTPSAATEQVRKRLQCRQLEERNGTVLAWLSAQEALVPTSGGNDGTAPGLINSDRQTSQRKYKT